MTLPNEPAIDPATFAASVRALLDEDPRRYRYFAAYWWFVKALLNRYFDRHQMPILGGYEDPLAAARLPSGINTLQDMLAAAAEQYVVNARFNLGSNRVTDSDGDEFVIIDPDVEG